MIQIRTGIGADLELGNFDVNLIYRLVTAVLSASTLFVTARNS